MRISEVTSTDLFTGSRTRPLQIVRVALDGGPAAVRVEGPGVTTPEPVTGDIVEVPVEISGTSTTRRVTVIAETATTRTETTADLTVAEPGWTMWMVSHFHYDPVWWNTQGGFTESWDVTTEQRTAFELVTRHLDAARQDPDYKFVLAELDYLKPHWDARPGDRADLRAFLAEGRIEIVGGNYNEPSTNLTGAEATIRNAAYGIGFQRDVIGGDPRSAWMLDVFGHAPTYPGLMADAGLTSSAWARGPFHQWGPADNADMQFASEFEWISPNGKGLLTAYMANHYGAGWVIEQHPDVGAAMLAAYEQFQQLKTVAATRNVLLPVGGDHVIPSRWCTQIQREWNKRYVWPRFVVGLPRDFFAAVRSEVAGTGATLSPQTRDMNPVYPGKDVSYIDTKQAQRAAEIALLDAERLATLAALLGHPYPEPALDKAWRQLCFGAHHDAVTGSESDQVYLDLLGGWREAYELADDARRQAATDLAGHVDTRGEGRPVVVFNTLAHARDDLARVRLRFAPGETAEASLPGARADGVLRHEDGSLAETTLTFLARDVPGLGHQVVHTTDAAPALEPLGNVIENDAYRVRADGGALVSIYDKRAGRELLRGPGNELYLQEEYPDHPRYKEGPWLLLPKGPGQGAAGIAAEVTAERSPAGERLTLRYDFGGLRVTQEVDCWTGVDRVEFRTHVDGSIGSDRLLRVRFALDVPGALPVHEVGNAVIGRSFGTPDADAGPDAFTLDNPAYLWCGLSATVRAGGIAIGVAEVISDEPVRDLVAALAAQGVTSTVSRPDGPRYGRNELDSNLPDVRIVVGDNAYLTDAERAALRESGRVWVPAKRTFGKDVRGRGDLPILIVSDAAALIDDLADSVIEVATVSSRDGEPWCGHSVALLNRGTPGCVAETDGTLHLNLMRACSGWPAGVWIDGERRTAPDGSSFQWQHWTHTFEYALVSGDGDWRDAGFAAAGQRYSHSLVTTGATAHDGDLTAPPLSIEGDVQLGALKPADGGFAVRCYEPHGRPATARITGLTDLTLTDLLEQPRSRVDEMVLSPADTVTVTAPGLYTVRSLQETAQPVLTRYWLHGKGAAPIGDMPVAVHLTDGDPLRVTVAAGPLPASGDVELSGAESARTRYDLAPGEHLAFDAHRTGTGLVAARIRDPYGQILEDVLGAPDTIDAALETRALSLAPGEHGQIVLRLTSPTELRGEAQLLSPYGSWEMLTPWTRGFAVTGTERLVYDVRMPGDARPGAHWWALVKVMAFGRLHYTEAIEVTTALA